MFTSIKRTILNVTKNVGIINTSEKSKPEELNYSAGQEILLHYEKNWEELHLINETNAKNADELANTIELISEKVKEDKKNLEMLTNMLMTFNLQSAVSNCVSQVKELYVACDRVEKKLIELESTIDDIEFANLKNMHMFHLSQYKVKKEEQLEATRKNLQAKYDKVVAEHELDKKNISEERQKVFQEAFKNDLEIYKSLGTIPKVNLPKRQTSALLEEIQLDYDQNELDKFFEEENGNMTS